MARHKLYLHDAEHSMYRAEFGKKVRFDMPLTCVVHEAAGTDWLWANRIPNRRVTIIEGPPKSGKSFVAYDLAARLSAGATWPDGPAEPRSPGGTFVLCRQDDSPDLLGRRFYLAGGNPNYVAQLGEFLTAAPTSKDDPRRATGGDRPFSLPDDLPVIEDFLDEHKETRLVVIDPLSDFCADARQMDEAIHQLNGLAAEYDVAVVATLRADYRFNSSGALQVKSLWPTAAARCTWCVVPDPDQPSRRLFVPTRMNFCEEPPGLAFSLSEGRVVWDVGSEVSASDPVRELSEGEKWLADLLAEQEQPARDIFRLGQEFGYTPRMLHYYGRRLGVQKRRVGYGKQGHSIWSRNGHGAHQNGNGAHVTNGTAVNGEAALSDENGCDAANEVELAAAG